MRLVFFWQEGDLLKKLGLAVLSLGRDGSGDSLKDSSSYKQYRGVREGGEVAWSLPQTSSWIWRQQEEARQWAQRKAPTGSCEFTPMKHYNRPGPSQVAPNPQKCSVWTLGTRAVTSGHFPLHLL